MEGEGGRRGEGGDAKEGKGGGYGYRQAQEGEGGEGMTENRKWAYKRQEGNRPFSPSKQGGIDHTQQTCLRRVSQSCEGVNSLLREGARTVQEK